MKAKELAKILLENPDFDVVIFLLEKDDSDWGVSLRTFAILGYDIGYSKKQIALDIKETGA